MGIQASRRRLRVLRFAIYAVHPRSGWHRVGHIVALHPSLHDPRRDHVCLWGKGSGDHEAGHQSSRPLHRQPHSPHRLGCFVHRLPPIGGQRFQLPRTLARLGSVAARRLPRSREQALACSHHRRFPSGNRIQPPPFLGMRSIILLIGRGATISETSR